MRVLIAISSLKQYEDNHQAMRMTWLGDAIKAGMDYRFFLSDTISMTDKLKQKMNFALKQCFYDYMFSCFPDTYACPERLLLSGFESFDYFGSVFKYDNPGSTLYCHGGAGYFLSRKAMEIAANNPTSYLNDDCWLGDVLSREDVSLGHTEDFRQHEGSPLRSNNVVTSHLSDAAHYQRRLDLGIAGCILDEHKNWIASEGNKPYTPTYKAVEEVRHPPAVQMSLQAQLDPRVPQPIGEALYRPLRRKR